MHLVFHPSSQTLLRTGAVLFVLGFVWAAIALHPWDGTGRVYETLTRERDARWYVIRYEPILLLALGTALLGFGLTM